MRIGIITFHRPENFGSALQAFALYEYLSKQKHDVYVIDFVFPRDMKQYRLFRTHVYIGRPWSVLGDIVYFKRNVSKKIKFRNFRKQYLRLTDSYVYQKDDLTTLNKDFDAFICGSDQIWNLDCTGGIVPEYFLEFVDNNRLRISYAPSMPENPKKEYQETLRSILMRFDSISVRENKTKFFFENELHICKPVEHVIDPTLLLDPNDYIDRFGLIKKEEKYIFVYVLGNTDIKEKIVMEANRKSEETGLPIRYVMVRRLRGLRNSSYLFGIGPIEFLDMILNASFVITDSFHATVFAILFGVPFCTFSREGTSSRMKELLDNFELSENYYSGDGQRIPPYKPTTNDSMNMIKSYRKSSSAFLLNSLDKKFYK